MNSSILMTNDPSDTALMKLIYQKYAGKMAVLVRKRNENI